MAYFFHFIFHFSHSFIFLSFILSFFFHFPFSISFIFPFPCLFLPYFFNFFFHFIFFHSFIFFHFPSLFLLFFLSLNYFLPISFLQIKLYSHYLSFHTNLQFPSFNLPIRQLPSFAFLLPFLSPVRHNTWHTDPHWEQSTYQTLRRVTTWSTRQSPHIPTKYSPNKPILISPHNAKNNNNNAVPTWDGPTCLKYPHSKQHPPAFFLFSPIRHLISLHKQKDKLSVKGEEEE